MITRGTGTGCTGPDETYTYDDAGNRLTAGATTFAYTADGQLASCTVGCGTIAHDSAGRMTSLAGWSFLYDSEGRMTSACQAGSCTGSGFNRIDATYDGQGHRTGLKETTAAGAVTTTDFRYAGDAITAETVNGTLARTYVTDDTGRITKVCDPDCSGSNPVYLPTWNGHGDALALWRVEPDGTLALANSYQYTTWGTPSTTVAAGFTDLGFRFLYVGASDVQWDNAFELGLLYMHARHYSPVLGRFLQPDPARAEANPYAYAANSPVSKVDPAGRLFWFIVGAVVLSAVIDSAFYLATTPEQERNWQGWALYVAIGELFTFIPVAKFMRWGGRLTKLLIRPRGVITRIDPNKLWHIFGNPAHKLGPLVRMFGPQEAAFRAVEGAAQWHVTRYGIRGQFTIVVQVAGQRVVVSGTVINGVVKIGTFYIP